MKNCEECQSLIDLYLDDELTREQKQSFLSHISSCNGCREALEFAKSVKATLHTLPELEIPDDFTLKLKEKLSAEKPKRKGIGTYFVRYGSLAACLVLAVVVAQGLDKPDFTNSDDTAPDYSYSTMSRTIPEENITADQSAGEEIFTPTEDKTAKKAQNTKTVPKKATPAPQKDAAAVNEAVVADPIVEDNGLSLASVTDEVPVSESLSESYDEVNPTMRSISGGGSGGSSRAITDIVTISVLVEQFDSARIVAAEYAVLTDGVYSLDTESFKLLLDELENQQIDFTQHGDATEGIVKFVLKTK